jgi:hypothetical protein
VAVCGLGIVSLAVLAGCGEKAPAVPSPDKAGTTAAQAPSQDTVQNPIDTKAFESNPCSLLTKSQLAAYGVTKPGKKDPAGGNGPACNFAPDDIKKPGFGVSVNTMSGGFSGLERAKGQLGYFKETAPINGYKAVNTDIDSNGPSQGSCSTNVAVSSNRLLEVGISSGGTNSPYQNHMCGLTEQIAKKVIATAKGA